MPTEAADRGTSTIWRPHGARSRRCAMKKARCATAISWLSALEALAFGHPLLDLLAPGDRHVQRAGRARFLPRQHRGVVDRAGLDTAARGLAAPFGGDRQGSVEEEPDRAQARQDALAGGAGPEGSGHVASIYTSAHHGAAVATRSARKSICTRRRPDSPQDPAAARFSLGSSGNRAGKVMSAAHRGPGSARQRHGTPSESSPHATSWAYRGKRGSRAPFPDPTCRVRACSSARIPG